MAKSDKKTADNSRKEERYENGNLKAVYTVKESLKHGIDERYSEAANGRLLSETPYKYDVKHGVCREYHDNGVLWRTTPYFEGEKHGEIQFFTEDGEKAGFEYRIHGWRATKEEWLSHRKREQAREAKTV